MTLSCMKLPTGSLNKPSIARGTCFTHQMPTTLPNLRLTSFWNHVLKTRRPPLSTITNLLQPHPHPLATTANPEAIALARIDN